MSKATSKRPDGGQLERVESYQWPAGHIGQLSEQQRNALDRFKKLCEEKGYYTPATEGSEASHDDETLLRYLRARKWIPQDAFAQLKGTEDWRSENQLNTLYETIDVDDYDQTRRLYPQWTGRRDKRGMPLYVYEIATVEAKDVTAYASDKDSKQAKQSSSSTKTPWKMMRLFALYENLCRFVMPLCSALPDRQSLESPISQSNNIVDISKVSMAKFWSLRNHMGDASKLASAHYPETLDRIFVIGAPSYFPTIWEWAKRWFDPITVSKIFILSDKNMLETLSKYIDVDNIPKKYGGKLDWSFGDMPFLEPAIANRLQWKEDIMEKGHRTIPKGPIRWQYDENGGLVATAIGTEDGKPRQRVIAGLPKPEVAVARLALSPGRAHTASTSEPVQAVAEKDSASRTETNGAPPPPRPANMQTDANLYIGKAPDAASPASSRAGTYTVPYRDERNDVASPPVDSRQGTSNTRFEQQQNTHAEDQLADGTPEYRVDSQGEKQGLMEPVTVGQAPKEHPMPDPEGDKQPSVVEQAQAYATQASEQVQAMSQSVLAAVGLGGKKDVAPAEQEKEKKEDPEIDAMPEKNVEEFLRSQTMSQPQPPGR